MAIPPSASAFAKLLRDEGVTVVEVGDWETHNRNHMGPWGPVNGIVIHHTAGRDSLALCWSGTSALPGPLCHTHLAKDGVATMVGHGRANHAGTFAQNAHDAVVKESADHPRPDAAEPVDGNQHYYGIEIENLGDGRDPYPEVQYQAAVRWAAAICRAHGWSANSVIGHKEGTRRKIDPSFDLDTFRDAVAARLAHTPDWNPGDEEDDMALTAEEIKKIAVEVLTLDGVIDNPNPGSAATNPYISLETAVRNIETVVRRSEAKQAAQQETINQLVAAVGALAASVGELDPAQVVAELKAAIAAIDVRLEVA